MSKVMANWWGAAPQPASGFGTAAFTRTAFLSAVLNWNHSKSLAQLQSLDKHFYCPNYCIHNIQHPHQSGLSSQKAWEEEMK